MTVALVLLVGAGAGVLAGLFGVGGGIVFVPTLVLALSLTQLHAEATSLLAVIPLSAVGSWRQHRYGNVRVRTAAILGLGAVAGVEIGVVVAESLPEDLLRKLFAAFLVVTAVHLVWRARRA